MDQTEIVDCLVDRCKSLLESILRDEGPRDIGSVALGLLGKFRDVARATLQAVVDQEAERLAAGQPQAHCEGAVLRRVHTRKRRVKTLFGEVVVRVRTLRCAGCGSYVRPDDTALGVPGKGDYSDDVRDLLAPLAAELPLRVACDLLARTTGVHLSPHGALLMTSSCAADVAAERPDRERAEDRAVTLALGEDGADALGVEVSFDGVMAHIDKAWHEVKVASLVVRRARVVRRPDDPRLGEIVARRVTCVRGGPEAIERAALELLEKSGWTSIPVVEVLGDGAPWIWSIAERAFPKAHQALDWWHLRQHFFAYANAQWADDEKKARAWVDGKMDALAEDRAGDVLSGLKRTRARGAKAREELAALVGYVANNQGRICYALPGSTGFAIGSGSVEGACKHLVQTRFKRAGMRWSGSGFEDVLQLRIARVNGTLDGFWLRARERKSAA